MRKKGTEARSIGFYIILGLNIIFSIILALLIGFEIIIISEITTLAGALIGVDGALLGFMITIFAMYFTYNMPEGVKELLVEYGFYRQIPKDMLRSIIMLTLGIVLAIINFFVTDIAQSIMAMVSVVQFVAGLTLALYVTFRFFTVLKYQ